MAQIHLLEIHIHTADGEKHSFYVDEQQDYMHIQRGVVPSRLFANKQFLVAGTYFMAAFMSSEVVRVDFASVDWESPSIGPETRDVKEITEKELARHALPRLGGKHRGETDSDSETSIHTFAEFGLVDGQKVCCRIDSKAGGRLDQRQFLQNLTVGQGFVIHRMGGGIIVLNPTLISRWALYPGLAELPATAWRAHRLNLMEVGQPSLVFKKLSTEDLSSNDEDV
jgi:hypothetical protein